MGIDLPIPDYNTVCRRLKDCSIELGKIKSKENMYVVIDSTGVKIYGDGEQRSMVFQKGWSSI